MHAIAPVVARHGRDVDTLGTGILKAQRLVHGKPVLQRDETQHGGAEHVARDNLLGKPPRHDTRSLTVLAESLVPVGLGTLLIVFPPLTQRGHIVREYRSNTAVRIVLKTAEAHKGFRHGLYLKGKHAQTLHHGTHTTGHHAQILGADKHLRSLHKGRKLLHGLGSPEIIVAVEEILLVEAVEGALLRGGELCVVAVVLGGDAGMVETLVAIVLNKELGKEPETVALYLAHRHGERRHKLTQQRRRTIDRYLPDAEEAQHVVDAVGIEILSHLAEAAYPPLVTVETHGIPVVGGESPVLPVARELVGGSARRTVQIEQPGLRPRLDAGARNADGYVALEDDTVAPRIAGCLRELAVEKILHPDIIAHLLQMRLIVAVHLLLVIGGERLPVAEAGCVVCVAQMAEDGIGDKPVLIGLEERAERRRLQHGGALLGIEAAQIAGLEALHGLVVLLRELVEAHALALVGRHISPVEDDGKLREVDILRMQRKDGDGVVGVAVLPGVALLRVVDGQHLYAAQSGLRGPVHHALEVAEVAHALTRLTAQGKHRNHHTGSLPAGLGKTHTAVPHHDDVTRAPGERERAVVALLPGCEVARALVHDNVFVFEIGCEELGIHADDPLVGSRPRHHQGTLRGPLAQRGKTAQKSQTLMLPELGSLHTEYQRARIEDEIGRLRLRVGDAVEIGRGIEMLESGDVLPVVVQHETALRSGKVALHAAPLLTVDEVALVHRIAIDEARDVPLGDDSLAAPCLTVVGAEREYLRDVGTAPAMQSDLYAHVLPPLRAIF